MIRTGCTAQVQLKIHDSSPENLKPGVLNELANKLAGAGFHMAQATVRHGCILIEVEVLQVGEAAAAAAGQGKQSAGPQSGEVADDDGLASPAGVQAVQAALQAWLATSGITAGLPAGTQLLMQVCLEMLQLTLTCCRALCRACGGAALVLGSALTIHFAPAS